MTATTLGMKGTSFSRKLGFKMHELSCGVLVCEAFICATMGCVGTHLSVKTVSEE